MYVSVDAGSGEIASKYITGGGEVKRLVQVREVDYSLVGGEPQPNLSVPKLRVEVSSCVLKTGSGERLILGLRVAVVSMNVLESSYGCIRGRRRWSLWHGVRERA